MPRGAVAVAVLLWVPVAVVGVRTGRVMGQPTAWSSSGTGSLQDEPGVWLSASWTSGLILLLLMVFLVRNREGVWSVGYDVFRYLGTVALSIGVGGLSTLSGEHHHATLSWALPVTVVGVLFFAAPWLITAYRAALQRHRDEIRFHGAGSPGQVTGVWSFVEDERRLRHRATIRFTDTSGTRRWVRRLAPRNVRLVEEGDAVTVHFDPDHPGRRRSISVDWTSAAAHRATGRARRQRGPGRLP